jgi:hypothetical protein
MRTAWRATIGIASFALTLPVASCGGECQIPTCAVPFALRILVTAASGGPVQGVTVVAAGSVGGSAQCSVGTSATDCILPGPGGTYQLQISAPGFQTVLRTVTVRETTQECACSHVETEQVYVTLIPTP